MAATQVAGRFIENAISGLVADIAGKADAIDTSYDVLTYSATLTVPFDAETPDKKIVFGAGNLAITLEGTADGDGGLFLVVQDGTGGRTLSINSNSVAINPAANARTLVAWKYDGTTYDFDTNVIPETGEWSGVTADDIEVTDYTKGLVLYSANGTKWRIGMNNDGTASITNINTTPDAPTSPVTDDTADTFNWTNTTGFTALSDYEYTLNGGSSYATVTAKPVVVGDVAKATGQVGVRVKAGVGHNASATLYNAVAFTVNTADAPVVWINRTTGVTDNGDGTLLQNATATPCGGMVDGKLVTSSYVYFEVPNPASDAQYSTLYITPSAPESYSSAGAYRIYIDGTDVYLHNTIIGTCAVGDKIGFWGEGDDIIIKKISGGVTTVLNDTTLADFLAYNPAYFISGLFVFGGIEIYKAKGHDLGAI